MPLLAGIAAGVSAVASIASGIMGASQASDNNRSAKKAEKEQRRFNERVAKKTNEYNDKLDAADKANYYAMRDFSYETSLRNWERGAEIQDFKYLNALKEFEKSQTIGIQNLGLNAKAAEQAVAGEIGSLNDMFIQQGFQTETMMSALKQTLATARIQTEEQGVKLAGILTSQKFGAAKIQDSINQMSAEGSLQKESALVESLVAEGKTDLMQAGASKAKAKQSNMAALHRGLMALDIQLSGKSKQAAIALAELNSQSSLAKEGVQLNIEQINNTVDAALEEHDYNNRVMQANMQSAIGAAQRNIQDIALQKEVADVNTRASMMLMPERLSYDPVPQLPPERIFVERMEAIPGYVPPAAQQNVWAPLIQGVGSAATGLMQAEIGGAFK
jgi:F0F1-type ATP synthase membrane subunit c/vacuolar-type H+-ATPase subunit K